MTRATTLLIRVLLACCVLLAPAARAADFPTRPIMLVVPFAPGGFVHLVALLLSESMGSALGQPVVVLNQPGANGMLAASTVAKAAPDGYTIFLPTASILTINPHLYKNFQIDPRADFVPIGQVVNTTNMFVVSSNSGIKSFKDLVDRARANPDSVSYGSSGNGSIQHIAGEALQQQAKIKLLHVPYKGIGPALTDVVGGNLTMVFSDATAIPHIKGGRLTAIAVSPRPIDELPGVPALADVVAAAGVPNYVAPTLWYGLVAPKGTPADIVAKLDAALAQTLKKPEVRAKLLAAGALPADNVSSDYLAGVIRADFDRYGAMIKALHISVD